MAFERIRGAYTRTHVDSHAVIFPLLHFDEMVTML